MSRFHRKELVNPEDTQIENIPMFCDDIPKRTAYKTTATTPVLVKFIAENLEKTSTKIPILGFVQKILQHIVIPW